MFFCIFLENDKTDLCQFFFRRKHLFNTSCIEKQCTRPLIKCVVPKFENLWTMSHYFSELKGLGLDGFGHVSRMTQERPPKQAFLAKKRTVGRPQTCWENYVEDIGWNFNQVKCQRWWRTVMCGSSILSCCPHNLHGHKRALKEEKIDCICK